MFLRSTAASRFLFLGEGTGAAVDGGEPVSSDNACAPPKGEAGEPHEDVLKASPDEAVAALKRGLEIDQPSATDATRGATLTTTLGPGPATYVSEFHAVEFELQAGSLDEELPVEMAITQGLAFVDCHTEGSGG